MIMSAVKAAKAVLRKEVQHKISLISQEEKRRQSKIVSEKLFKLTEFQKAKHVSIFLSIDCEINTEQILRKMFEDGKDIFVPRCSQGKMDMVRLYSMDDWDTLPLTKYDIKQPSIDDNRDNAVDIGLDLILTPGIAFTKDGKRLGHGGGFYDGYLRKIKEIKTLRPMTIVLAYKEQIVDEVPTEPTDVQIDKVLYAD